MFEAVASPSPMQTRLYGLHGHACKFVSSHRRLLYSFPFADASAASRNYETSGPHLRIRTFEARSCALLSSTTVSIAEAGTQAYIAVYNREDS